MRRHSPRPRLLVPATLLVLATMMLSGCGGSEKSSTTPSAAMTTAKVAFDKATTVRLELSTDDKPDGGNAVLGASGVLTRQPAFDGEVKVLFAGAAVSVPVKAVDGKVFAKLPLTPRFAEIDPAEFGVPDPAGLIDPETGISALLLELKDLKSDGQRRDGKLTLSEYSGTLPGSLIKAIIPSAAEGSKFKTSVGVDDSGRPLTVTATGDFFDDGSSVTYEITLSDYDTPASVEAP